jgi:hypothetical protein
VDVDKSGGRFTAEEVADYERLQLAVHDATLAAKESDVSSKRVRRIVDDMYRSWIRSN